VVQAHEFAAQSRCYTEATKDNPCPNYGPDDAMVVLVKKMMDFDGLCKALRICI